MKILVKLFAFVKLLARKINSASTKAQNPFVDCDSEYNPFCRPIYNTLVWIEANDDYPNEFDNHR